MDELAKLVITLAMLRAGINNDIIKAVWLEHDAILTALLLEDISMEDVYDQVVTTENLGVPQE